MSQPLSGSRSGTEIPSPAPTTTGPADAVPLAASSGHPTSGAPGYGTPPGPGAPGYGTPPSPGTPPWPGSGPSGHSTTPEPGYGPSRTWPGGAMPAAEERNWGMAAHLSGFVAAYVALGFLGPLTVLLAVGNRSASVRRHAVEALNFNLSVLLYVVICVPLVFVLIGIPMLLALGLLYLVTSIQGALAASRGEDFRYPLTIRFVS